MDTENNHCNVRITFAIILASVGVAFISWLPQLLLGQQEIFWYQSGFLWAGIVIVFIALLILTISPRKWKYLGYLVRGLPRSFHKKYIFLRYGPKHLIHEPQVYEKDGKYLADVEVFIRNRDKFDIKVDLVSLEVCLEQKIDWVQKTPIELMNYPERIISVIPPGESERFYKTVFIRRNITRSHYLRD